MKNKDYAYRFSPSDYPDAPKKDLFKLPLDTHNQVVSAVSRFNQVKTPDGKDPDQNTKEEAWNSLKRSALELDYKLEVESWQDLEPHKALKSIKDTEKSIVIPLERAFLDTDTNKLVIEGVASSTNFDLFKTRITKECLEDIAYQINNSNVVLNTKIILESEHTNKWFDNLGVVKYAYTQTLDDGVTYLYIDAELDKDNPLSMYLYRILKRKGVEEQTGLVDEYPTPFIGLSLNNTVVDWEFYNEEDKNFYYGDGDIVIYDFKLFEGSNYLNILKVKVNKIAITSRPSNEDTFVSNMLRSIDDSIKEGILPTKKNCIKQTEDINNISLIRNESDEGEDLMEQEKKNGAVDQSTPTEATSEQKDVVNEQSQDVDKQELVEQKEEVIKSEQVVQEENVVESVKAESTENTSVQQKEEVEKVEINKDEIMMEETKKMIESLLEKIMEEKNQSKVETEEVKNETQDQEEVQNKEEEQEVIEPDKRLAMMREEHQNLLEEYNTFKRSVDVMKTNYGKELESVKSNILDLYKGMKVVLGVVESIPDKSKLQPIMTRDEIVGEQEDLGKKKEEKNDKMGYISKLSEYIVNKK